MSYFINLMNELEKKRVTLQELQLEIGTAIIDNMQEKDQKELPTIIVIDLIADEK